MTTQYRDMLEGYIYAKIDCRHCKIVSIVGLDMKSAKDAIRARAEDMLGARGLTGAEDHLDCINVMIRDKWGLIRLFLARTNQLQGNPTDDNYHHCPACDEYITADAVEFRGLE